MGTDSERVLEGERIVGEIFLEERSKLGALDPVYDERWGWRGDAPERDIWFEHKDAGDIKEIIIGASRLGDCTPPGDFEVVRARIRVYLRQALISFGGTAE